MKNYLLLLIILSPLKVLFSQTSDVEFRKSIFQLTESYCDDCIICDDWKRSSETIEYEIVTAYCGGKLIGEWKLFESYSCGETKYSSTGGKTRYSYNEAYNDITSEAYQRCSDPDWFDRIEREKLAEAASSKAEFEAGRKKQEEYEIALTQLRTKLKRGELIPDTVQWDGKIEPSNLSFDFIRKVKWEGVLNNAITKQAIQFVDDNTYVLYSNHRRIEDREESGHYLLLEDGTVLIERTPYINVEKEKATVFIEKLSFVEKEGKYYFFSSIDDDIDYMCNVSIPDFDFIPTDFVGEWTLRYKVKELYAKYTADLTLKISLNDENELIGLVTGESTRKNEICIGTPFVFNHTENARLSMKFLFEEDCCNGDTITMTGFIGNKEIVSGWVKASSGYNGCYNEIRKSSFQMVRSQTGFPLEDFSTSSSNNSQSNKIANRNRSSSASSKENTAINIPAINLWSTQNGNISIKNEVASIAPLKKRMPITLTSPPINSSASYLRISMEQSRIKNGNIKVLVQDLESGEIEEVYSEVIRQDLDQISIGVDKILNLDFPVKSAKTFRVKKIDMSAYRSKSIKIIISYKAAGLLKPPLYIGEIK